MCARVLVPSGKSPGRREGGSLDLEAPPSVLQAWTLGQQVLGARVAGSSQLTTCV